MAEHFGDTVPYLPEFWDELETCMNKFGDPNVTIAADNTWKGMVDYFQNPRESDPWINCLEEPTNDKCYDNNWWEGRTKQWSYFNRGGDREMLVMEPCNFVSNMAFYHSALRICNYPDFHVDEEQ